MTAAAPRFVVVAKSDDLRGGRFIPVLVDGHSIVLASAGEAVYAFQATCPHEKADLAQGRIEACCLICPRHLASFSLDDGAASRGWKLDPLKLYPARVSGDNVEVDAAAIALNPPAGRRKVWDLTGR